VDIDNSNTIGDALREYSNRRHDRRLRGWLEYNQFFVTVTCGKLRYYGAIHDAETCEGKFALLYTIDEHNTGIYFVLEYNKKTHSWMAWQAIATLQDPSHLLVRTAPADMATRFRKEAVRLRLGAVPVA